MLTVNAKLDIMLIYKITNTINNKIYIGQTTQSLEDRWRDCKYSGGKIAMRRPIIRAIHKYGFNNFKIEIIQDNILNKDDLDSLEKYYIKFYNATNREYGYNVELGGNGRGKHAAETKLKMSIAQQGKLNHMYGKKGKLNHSSKPIIDITTGIIYDSATEAAEKLGFSITNISKVCSCAKGIRNSALGHVFRYLDKNNQPIYVDLPITEKNVRYVYNETLNCRYESIEHASQLLNCTQSNIDYACNNENATCKGCKLRMGEYHKITYNKGSKVFDKVLEKYMYLVNTVPSF